MVKREGPVEMAGKKINHIYCSTSRHNLKKAGKRRWASNTFLNKRNRKMVLHFLKTKVTRLQVRSIQGFISRRNI